MPRFRILAGPSLTDLKPVEANSGGSVKISSDVFDGEVAVYLKGFVDEKGNVGRSSYFEQEDRKNITWSIQMQGRFLKTHSADDIVFGNVFDHGLNLPWGFSGLLSFMQYVDPTLEQDLASQSKPWALSPLITTMPFFAHARLDELHKVPPFPPLKPLKDDISELHTGDTGEDEKLKGGSLDRRGYFKDAAHRKQIKFGSEDLITADFCYNYLHFEDDSVTIRIPGGISFDILKYWDGQPVRFVCCERVPHGQAVDGVPWGKVFWCVVIERVDEVAEDEEEDDQVQSDDID